MAVPVEVEDDVFFADLSKQISLLIMDDEEDSSVSHATSVSLQVFSHQIHPTTMQTSMFVNDPNYCKRESKGTGVFIPQISNPRRRNNNNKQQGRHGSSNNSKFHGQFDNSSRGLLQHVPYNNSAYDSFNSRRFQY